MKSNDHLCVKCGKRFPDKRKLTIHSKYHEEEEPVVCSICGKNFGSKVNFEVVNKVYGQLKKRVDLT